MSAGKTEDRNTSDTIYQLKVTLKAIKPPIWRRIQVPGNITLAKLHKILQAAMGWEDYHLYEFQIGRVSFGTPDPEFDMPVENARTARLNKVVPEAKTRFQYIYDFGDYWVHDVLVEKILPPEEGVRYPVCTGGKRACPPEDCGGIPGYLGMLETIKNPGDPEYEEILEWLGGTFDPEEFDLEAINNELKRIK
ncbi:MAG TPA: plasmid pRiA4b ORF-3 family protein [Firmicutes bacterium]|nr:plasmid pRiA4b ORF-3 family protein [Bacillota bacterium]